MYSKSFEDDLELIGKLRIRADIRRMAKDRKSVQENQPDRIADLLEEAARRLEFHLEKDRYN